MGSLGGRVLNNLMICCLHYLLLSNVKLQVIFQPAIISVNHAQLRELALFASNTLELRARILWAGLGWG